MNLRIEVNDATELPKENSADFALEAESLGFDGVGMPDHPHTGQDVFVRLFEAACITEKVTLFPSVTNPVTRNTSELIDWSKKLNEVAPGRIRLILGGGDNAVKFFGKRPATTAELIDAVNKIKTGLIDTGIKVFINASSPKMLEAGGYAADGVYAMVGVDPMIINKALEHIHDGARKNTRDPLSIPIAFGLPVFISESRVKSIEYALPYAFSNFKKFTRVFSQVMKEQIPSLEGIENYSKLSTNQAEQLSQAIAICGTSEEAAVRTKELGSSLGQNHFIARVQVNKASPIRALREYGKSIFP